MSAVTIASPFQWERMVSGLMVEEICCNNEIVNFGNAEVGDRVIKHASLVPVPCLSKTVINLICMLPCLAITTLNYCSLKTSYKF